MNKLYNKLIRIFTLMGIFIVLSGSKLQAQSLYAFLRIGTTVVTSVSVCESDGVALNVAAYGSSLSYSYSWNTDIPSGYYASFNNQFVVMDATPAGVYFVEVEVSDGFYAPVQVSVPLIIKQSPSAVIDGDGVISNSISFCNGNSVNIYETGGQIDVTYQWNYNFAPIPGETGETYTVGALGSGPYNLTVIASSGCEKNSNPIIVTVFPLPDATASNGGPYCDGATINLESGPLGAVNYSWTSNAITPFSSDIQNPSITGATVNNSGDYTVIVTDGHGCKNSATTTVEVSTPVDAGSIGTDQVICYNTTPDAIINVAAASGGIGDFTYLWQQKIGAGTWAEITGATELTYAPSALTQTTQFKRIAINSCGTVETIPVTITVREALDAGEIGNPQTICYNTTPSPFISVADASGGDEAAWSYLWQKKVGEGAWTDIGSSNSTTYAAGSLITTTVYRRVATNATCDQTVYSNEITVTVNEDINPGIISESQSVCYGGDPDAFTATAATGGNGTTTYIWESKPTTSSSWTTVATTELYDVPSGIITSTDYRRIATNTCGSKESNIITITVYPETNPGIIQYNGGDICYLATPDEITSTQEASGGFGAWTYKWFYQSNCSGIWNEIEGATSTSYAPPANQTETRCYKRVATNATCGSIETAPVTIIVKPAVDGGIIGSDQDVCYGDDPTPFSNVTSPSGGIGAFAYQWQLNNNGSWDNIVGATESTYDAPANITQTTKYRRLSTNTCGSDYSNEITITVTDEVKGGTILAPSPSCYNSNPDAITNETLPTGGTGTWHYSWEYKIGEGAWNVIPSSDNNYYDPADGETVTKKYRRKATNDCGSAYSNEIEVVIWDMPVGGSIVETDQNICYNGDPSEILSLTLPSGGEPSGWTYVWEYQIDCAGTWYRMDEEIGISFDPPAGLTENRCYRRIEQNLCQTFSTPSVTVLVGPPLVPGTIDGTQSICFGDNATMLGNVIEATGEGTLNYFWQKKTSGAWTNIAAANAASYTPATGSVTETTTFRRGVTDNCNTEYSNEIVVTVNDLPTVTLPDFADVCIDGSPIVLTGGTPDGGAYSGSGVIAGQFSPSVAGIGTHSITYTYNDGCEGSATKTITVNDLPSVFNVTGGGDYCESNPILEVELDGSQNGVEYTLYNNGVATTIKRNGNGSLISFGAQTAGDYTVEAIHLTTGCTASMNGNVIFTAVPEISGNTISSDQTICQGSVATQIEGSTPTGGDGTFTYQWLISPDGTTFADIEGATSKDYSPLLQSATRWYRRIAYSTTCESESNSVEITVVEPVTCNNIYTNQTICYNTIPDIFTGDAPCGGDGIYSYQWQISTTGIEASFTDIAGATSDSYQHTDALTADTWFRRVVSSGPCANSSSASVKVTVKPIFEVLGITPVNPTCNGASNGSATVMLNGGVEPFTYNWNSNPIQTTATATNLSANVVYTITITDAIGCITTDNITLDEPLPIGLAEAVSAIPVAGCHGTAEGRIEALASGGTPNYIYTLQGAGGSTKTLTPIHPAKAIFDNLLAGTYSLSITDANGCTPYVQSNIVIDEPDELSITDVTTTPISCYGEADGTITIVVAGGTMPYEYSIDGGFTFSTTNVFSVGEGFYDIVVKDAYGCEQVWATQVNLVEPTQILFGYTVTPITTCNGDNTGIITISNAQGGSGEGYQYSISMPEYWVDNPVFSNLPGGTGNSYYIKVKDSHGCISVANEGNPIFINQPAEISFNVTPIHVTGCWYNNNGQIRISGVTGGTGAKRFSIDDVNYGTNPNFIVGVGTYTVYVKDAQGCIATQVVTINGPDPIVLNSYTVTPATCFGFLDGKIEFDASGGTGNLEYSLDDVVYQSINNFFVGVSGNNTLFIRDENGCTLTQDFTVNPPNALYFTSQVAEDITCNGLVDGTITLQASGGNGIGYQYSINGGITYYDNGGIFTGLAAGSYTPAVTDGTCSVIGETLIVVEPPMIEITSEVFTQITCNNANDGTITVTAIGGTGILVYQLYKDLVLEQSNNSGLFSGLAEGSYVVEVTDENDCTHKVTSTMVIVNPEPVNFTAVKTDLTCYGYDNGTIVITPTGGTGVYQYSINGSEFASIPLVIDNLGSGVYTIVVRDDNNCESASQDIEITEPEAIDISPVVSQITCFGLTNGKIVTTASGGSGTYQFRINSGTWQSSGTFEDLSAGVYTVEVSDGFCAIDSSVTIIEPAVIQIDSIQSANIVCNGDEDGTINVWAHGGTGSLIYSLFQKTDFISSNTNGEFTGLNGGKYIIKVDDVNTCPTVESDTIVVYEPDSVSFNYTVADVKCNGNNDGSITIIPSGGSGIYDYSINNSVYLPMSNPHQVDSLFSGTYLILVRDSNGCLSDGINVEVSQNSILELELSGTDILCDGTSGTIVASAVGGNNSLYEYSLDGTTWQTSDTFNIDVSGSYEVLVRDANGCISSDSISIGEPIPITITNVTNISPSCQAQGSITVLAEGGVEPLIYTLVPVGESNGTGVFENLVGGSYRVEIVDSDGCGPVSTDTIILVDPLTITINSVVTTNVGPCYGEANGTITIDAIGGTPPLRYSIDGGTTYQTDSIFLGVEAGVYTIVVNDANECPQSAVATITEPDSIVLQTPIVIQESEPNANDGSIVLVATGGQGILTYTIQPLNISNTTGEFVDLGTGVYRIDVTDDNGCTRSTEDIRISGMKINIVATDITCYGANNGSIDINIEGGFPPYTVACASIVNGTVITLTPMDSIGSHFTATGLSVDTILVTITNSMGTMFPSRQFEISQPDTMVVSLGVVTNPLCAGETNGSINFNITGGIPDYSIAWGDSTIMGSSITGLDAGSYSFVVTDANGCVSDTIKTILVSPDSIYVSVQIVQETSYGANNGIVQVDAIGGTGSYSYVLQPTAVTSDIPIFNSVGSGTYFVQVFDENGCMAQSDEFTICGTDIVIDTIINAICYGDTNGYFEFSINYGFYPFNVSYISATDTINLVATDSTGRHFIADSIIAGEYSIVVIDSLSNTITSMVEILQPDSVIASITNIQTPYCAGDSTASVSFNISGGTPDYIISWNESTVTGMQIDSVQAGAYTFSITDINGCYCASIDTIITQPDPIILADTILNNPTCFGEAIGSIEVNPLGGTGTYTYQLDTCEAIANNYFGGLTAGNYMVTIIDSLGCSSTFNLTLSDTSKIVIDANIYGETMTCPYDTEGYISIDVTGGYGNYQYIWPSIGASTDSVSGLKPGNYALIVVDAVNCVVSDTFTINGPNEFVFNQSVITEASCHLSNSEYDGTMTVSGFGGNVGTISYSLLTPENDTITVGAPNFNHLQAGAYVIFAEDAMGCLYEKLDTIPINPLYKFEVNVPDTVVCFANDVVLNGFMVYDSLYDSSIDVTYSWWKENNNTSTPDFIGENYNVYLPESKTYRFKLRVTMNQQPMCYEEDWAEINVYPEIGVHVPIYVSSVQNDTIISILLDNEYNLDVNTRNVDYATEFRWYPSEMFTDTASWNTSILLTTEKRAELNALYPERFVEMRDPQTNKKTKFILADVVATTDVGCVDSLRLYTKIVNKLYLASAFSPNGDGRNDVWMIPKDYLFPDLEIEIFNRWGSLVWSAKGEKAARGWNGKTNSGKDLPIGTYWYVIKYNLARGDSWEPETGSVTIVK